MHWILENYCKNASSTGERKSSSFFKVTIFFVRFMQSDANSMTIWERITRHKKAVVEPRQSTLFLESIEVAQVKKKLPTFFVAMISGRSTKNVIASFFFGRITWLS